MTSDRLLFSTPLSRNRRFYYLNRVCFLFENVESETPIALAGFFGFLAEILARIFVQKFFP